MPNRSDYYCHNNISHRSTIRRPNDFEPKCVNEQYIDLWNVFYIDTESKFYLFSKVDTEPQNI